MVVRSCPSHCASFFRIGNNGDVVAVQLEVGHVVCGSRNDEAVGGVSRDDLFFECPVHEVVAFVGGGRQGAGIEMVVCACPSHGASFFRIGNNGDVVAVQLEVGHVVCGFCHHEAVGGVSRDDFFFECPVHEVVAFVGCGLQCGCRAVDIGATAVDRAAFSRVSFNGDVEGFPKIHHEWILQRAITITYESDGIGRNQVKLLVQDMVIKPKIQLVTALAINRHLYHIALRWCKESEPSRTTAFLAAEHTQFESCGLLLNIIDLHHTRQGHVVLVRSAVGSPMVVFEGDKIRHKSLVRGYIELIRS